MNRFATLVPALSTALVIFWSSGVDAIAPVSVVAVAAPAIAIFVFALFVIALFAVFAAAVLNSARRNDTQTTTLRRPPAEHLARLLDSQDAAIDRSLARIDLSVEGTILDANQNFLEMTGYTKEELVGRDHRILVPAELHDSPQYAAFRSRLGEAEFHSGEFERVAANRSSRRVLATYNPVLNEDGSIDRIVEYANDITDRRKAEEALKASSELQLAARQAGKAEVATGVLHNVGNVLNSVNVSVSLLRERLNQSPVRQLVAASEIIAEHEKNDLAGFFADDPRGRHFPDLLKKLALRFQTERDVQIGELETLIKDVEHIKEIVSEQQSFAKKCVAAEPVDLIKLFEAAIKINEAFLQSARITLVRDFTRVPVLQINQHDVLQILINLIKNAGQSITESSPRESVIRLTASVQGGFVRLQVVDNGIGIAAKNLNSVFRHGFTTRTSGHGFGLHSSANTACAMGGSLSAQSDGIETGATFTLELPIPVAAAPATMNNLAATLVVAS